MHPFVENLRIRHLACPDLKQHNGVAVDVEGWRELLYNAITSEILGSLRRKVGNQGGSPRDQITCSSTPPHYHQHDFYTSYESSVGSILTIQHRLPTPFERVRPRLGSVPIGTSSANVFVVESRSSYFSKLLAHLPVPKSATCETTRA
jgi:hypothetical protein